MLFHYESFDHPIDQLQRHVCFFMRAARRAADVGRHFEVAELFHPDFQKRLKRSKKLHRLFSAFYHALRRLTPPERVQVYRAFRNCMNTRRLFRDDCVCLTSAGLPTAIRAPTLTLFSHLYDYTLGSGGWMKDHYEAFYKRLPTNWCPFCGIERMEHHEHYKQDYDHLMCQKYYPFAAVNMGNLVPMGQGCNKVFKKDQDMLHNAAGQRRKAFYPFDPPVRITLSLVGSTLPTGGDDKGTWAVAMGPDVEEVRTWKDVFKIEDRYQKTILESDYYAWLTLFRNYVRDVAAIPEPWTCETIRGAVQAFQREFPENDFRDHMFFKRAVCDLWMNDADAFFLKALANGGS